MKRTVLIFLVLPLLFLSGCASIYQSPKTNEPTAYVRVKNERSGLATWIHLQIEAIDNRSAGFQLMGGKFRIYPGEHRLTIKTSFNNGFFSSGPFESFSDVSGHFEAGKTYTVHAKVQGSRVLTWISKQGKKISGVSVSTYHTAPQNTTVFIPVQR